jgi:hypothetical protein
VPEAGGKPRPTKALDRGAGERSGQMVWGPTVRDIAGSASTSSWPMIESRLRKEDRCAASTA